MLSNKCWSLFCRREVDGTYILELHKDDKKGEAKATIVMDFCTEVVRVSSIQKPFFYYLIWFPRVQYPVILSESKERPFLYGTADAARS